MNYLVMDRASEAAANDLAEVRKLIEGMNALVNSQIQQQQQQAQQQQLHLQFPEYPTLEQQQQQQQEAALMAATLAAATEHQHYLNVSPSPSPSLSPQQTLNSTVDTSQLEQSNVVNEEAREELFTNTASEPVKPQEASKNTTPPPPSAQQQTTDTTVASAASATNAPIYSAPLPQTGVIVEVIHLTFNRVLYFQLAEDVTIEPMIAWLRLSYQDAAISGMVLQYKGFDGLWKCLLNRDDSLKRILKQSMKGNTMLQMRVPREQDLLSSGYTDRRLLALTKTERM